MNEKESEFCNLNSNEGVTYSSSVGMFDGNEGVEVKSMDFDDLISEVSTESQKDDEKYYVFIRNVSSKYKNPLELTNLIDKGIKLVDKETKDGFFNHSTISYSLKDGFVGLTLDSNIHKAKREYLTDTSKNHYTSTADDTKSKYVVYMLEVSKSEYDKIKDMIDYSVRAIKLDYSVITNFFIGLKLIGNKLGFNRQSTESNKFERYKLVCSTFVAYILAKCVSSIKMKFSKKDMFTMTPNDIVNRIPGLKHAFGGIWKDYNKDCDKYILRHPKLHKFTK